MDDEWKRLSENPDNVIMSESLRDMLDTSELASEPLTDRSVVALCTVKYIGRSPGSQEESISGTLMSFAAEGSYRTLAVLVSAEDSLSMFPIQDIVSVEVSNNVNNVTDVFQVDAATVVNVGVEFQYGVSTKMGASSAILTLTIPR